MRLNTALLLVGALPGLSIADGVVRRRAVFARQAYANTTSVEATTTGEPIESTMESTMESTGAAATTVATTATATSASSSATSTVDLSDATLENASVITVDGKPAVLMSPPANGQASIAVNADPPATSSGQGCSVNFDLGPSSGSTKHKRAATDCSVAVLLDGQTVYNETLDSVATTVNTDAVYISDSPQLQIVETCGDDPVPIVVSNVALVAQPVSASSSPASSVPATSVSANGTTPATGSVTPTGSVPVTSGTATGTETGAASGTATGTASGTATGTASGTTTGSNVVPTETAGFPGLIGDFAFFGCVGSIDNFPTFSLIASSEYMDLNICTAYCGNMTFAGVYDSDCYCGSTIDGALTERVSTAQCDIPCPGDDTENCGGIRPDTLARRQAAVPNTVLLTVYININLPATTVTATVTSIATIVSTASAGDIVTVTAAAGASSTTIICVGGYCGSWTFIEFPGSECSGELVYVIETCSCEGGWTYQPKLCTGDSCAELTVYKPVECTNTTTATAYAPTACSSCAGGVAFTAVPGTGATATIATVGTTPTGTGSVVVTTGVVVSTPSSTVVTAGSDRVAATLGFLAPALFALVLLY